MLVTPSLRQFIVDYEGGGAENCLDDVDMIPDFQNI